jgi:hypothetical protein
VADNDDKPIGWGNPPKATRFEKHHRRSRGKRRRKKAKPLPHEAVLGQLVTSNGADGNPRQITLEQALVWHLKKCALLGDMAVSEQFFRASADIRKHIPAADADDIDYVEMNNWLGSVNDVVLPLGMARKKDPRGPSPKIELEPWLVQMALARLDRQLTIEEQREVWEATLTPKRVQWPDWWTEHRGTGSRKKRRGFLEEGVFYPPSIEEDTEKFEL